MESSRRAASTIIYFMYFSGEERYRRAAAAIMIFFYFSRVERSKMVEATLYYYILVLSRCGEVQDNSGHTSYFILFSGG